MTANGTNLVILRTYLRSEVDNFGHIFEPMVTLNWPLYVYTVLGNISAQIFTWSLVVSLYCCLSILVQGGWPHRGV
jgi:hypothetical protein